MKKRYKTKNIFVNNDKIFRVCTLCHFHKEENDCNFRYRKVKNLSVFVSICRDCEKLKNQDYDQTDNRKKSRSLFDHGQKRKEYRKNRFKSDVSLKLRTNISKTIRDMLKSNNGSKNGCSILKYLPYTIQDLKSHLEKQFEPWMTWENWGKYNSKTWDDNNSSTWTWQIDHIYPQSKLLYASMQNDNFKKCWDLSNLRPLQAKINILEGAR